jgi:hypothetical protein
MSPESEVSSVRGGTTRPGMGGIASQQGEMVEIPRSVSVGQGRTSVPLRPVLTELLSQHCLEGEGDTRTACLCHNSDREHTDQDHPTIKGSEGGGRLRTAKSHVDSRGPEAS